MNTICISKFHYTPMINSKYKFEMLVWRLMKIISSEQGGKLRKYRKFAANMIQARPLQSPNDDLGFVVT